MTQKAYFQSEKWFISLKVKAGAVFLEFSDAYLSTVFLLLESLHGTLFGTKFVGLVYKWRMDLKWFWIVLKWNEHVRTRFERSKWSGFWIPRPGKSVQPRFQNHFRLNPLRSNPKNHTHTPRNYHPRASKSNSLYPFLDFSYGISIKVRFKLNCCFQGYGSHFCSCNFDLTIDHFFYFEYLVLVSLCMNKVFTKRF